MVGCSTLQPASFNRIIRILSQSSCDVAIGQQLEIEAQSAGTAVKRRIMELKTGSLFSASLEIGAVCANCSPEVQKITARLGREFGVVFQSKDDIDDSEIPFVDGGTLSEAIGQMNATFTSLHEILGVPLPLLGGLLGG
jgi:geranylgeranyl pyrophosphate synthase